MAVRNPSVTIINGTVDNSPVGATTPSTGTFTTLIGGGGSANYGQLTGGATNKAVQFQTLGSDGSVSLAIQPKGTGAIDLATGSSGVNISNGGTVTAITATVAGSGYTSAPSAVITAPTTSGGVQATYSPSMRALTATISAGGSGYLVGDILTISGTTGTAAQLTVATLSGSAVATVTISTQGNMTALPTNPASVTGGTGTGATFTMTYGLAITQPSPSNAGSGYVEQPTVSFSGGGGSGATAYATVGSATVIRTLGSTSVTSGISFQTPAGEQVRITDPGNTTVNYIAMWGGASGVAPRFVARGTDADVSLLYSVKGAGNHVFRTNDTNQTQFQISHTASAVNYVQVTGATTASKVVAISAQGSDTDVTLSLSPKGAGTIRFGTHTGTILTPTGYITITDSGGTTRRLLVG